ncbi:MAG: zinc ribbon domain-containing protein [Erysipelothrix sp.]|jgi:Zn finger protein HypA/HybF involved in hydrogenase expression|nr:zinc ribbon domain-containing protein [Erysipelothrix sp.]
MPGFHMGGILILPLLLGLIIAAFPLIIGIYVYNDAQNRGMNGLLWALVAALVPTFFGLLAYLIVRTEYANLRCAVCDFPIKDDYVSCPNCGVHLKATCEHCQNPIQPHWKVCPHCSERIVQTSTVQVPVVKSDRSLIKLLLLLVAVPILLLLVSMIVFAVRYIR